MKKVYLILVAIMGVTLFSCEPMEDLQDEANQEIQNSLTEGSANYTLTEDDYETIGIDDPNFNSDDDAKELIPEFLSKQFPYYGEGTSLTVFYDIFDPVIPEAYTVADADYEEAGLSDHFFSGMGDIQNFLDMKYPRAEEGDYVELTYQTLADEIAYNLTDGDFELIGDNLGDKYPAPASSAANYGNFDRREGNDAYWDNDMILEAINEVLSENFEDVEGQKYNVSYDIYNGSSGSESMTVQFDGNSYVAVGGTSYEFTDADYDLVGTEFADQYPGPAGNAAQFSSFDVRSSSANFWSEDMLTEAVNAVLMERYPDAEEGAKFEVSYAVYNGSVATIVQSFVLQGDSYVIDENASISTIEATNIFALTEGSWNMPYTLTTADYTEMGQTYPNFDDEEEAYTRIGIFLNRKYPYAEEGDFKAIAYDFYVSGEGTSTRYTNFRFEDGEFVAIPRIKTSSFQFGYIDGAWVPDNTIKYYLAGSDYSLIADALAEQYPDPVASMTNYSNFDRRAGNGAYWSDTMILEAMRVLLNEIAPDAEEGQKYVITYDIYNGSNTTEDISLIKQDGEWKRQ